MPDGCSGITFAAHDKKPAHSEGLQIYFKERASDTDGNAGWRYNSDAGAANYMIEVIV